jgi:hypothetical protein
MNRLSCACVFLVVSTWAQAETCALPSAVAGQPYVALANLSKRELHLVLNEYMFRHRWMRHSEAVSAGFRLGDRVYGEDLKSGGRFTSSTVAAWRRTYLNSGRAQFLDVLGSKVDMTIVDPALVNWILGVCLGSALWSETRIINDCRFVFTAGVAMADASPKRVRPVRFEVHGARCGRWPAHAISGKGDSVQCVRSGDSPVTLELVTDRAGATRQALSARVRPDLPPEPLEVRKVSEASEVFKLWRSHDYRLQQLGKGCPNCRLYAADIRPSVADASIVRAVTVSSSGGGWQPCPAGWRCGVFEFSPPDNPRLSGCAGLPVCRVWRLTESDAEAFDVIQLTYERSEVACTSCPDHEAFETAHRQWQQARDNARDRCEVFADWPAQIIEPAPKN